MLQNDVEYNLGSHVYSIIYLYIYVCVDNIFIYIYRDITRIPSLVYILYIYIIILYYIINLPCFLHVYKCPMQGLFFQQPDRRRFRWLATAACRVPLRDTNQHLVVQSKRLQRRHANVLRFRPSYQLLLSAQEVPNVAFCLPALA